MAWECMTLTNRPSTATQTITQLEGQVRTLTDSLQDTRGTSDSTAYHAARAISAFEGPVLAQLTASLDKASQDLTSHLVAATEGEQERTTLMRQRTALEQALADANQTAIDIKAAHDGNPVALTKLFPR